MIKRISYAAARLLTDGVLLFIVATAFLLIEASLPGATQISMSAMPDVLYLSLSTLYIYFIGLGVVAAYILGPAIFGVRRWVGYVLSVIPLLLGLGLYLSAKVNDLPDLADWLIVSAIASVCLFVADHFLVRRLLHH